MENSVLRVPDTFCRRRMRRSRRPLKCQMVRLKVRATATLNCTSAKNSCIYVLLLGTTISLCSIFPNYSDALYESLLRFASLSPPQFSIRSVAFTPFTPNEGRDQRERECSQLPFKEQRILLPSMCLTSDRFRDFELQISDLGAYGQWLSLFVSDFR